jgi:uncharacterized protein (DUF433 family)
VSALQEAEKLLAGMTRAEKAQLLQWVVRDLGDAFPGIESIPGVCGGEPCIVRTRIPVWVLEQARRLGASEAEILGYYPSLRAEDLVHAWAYVRAHREEIAQQIHENEEAQKVAQLYANANLPLPVVEEPRRLGHDVLTTHEAGKAGQSVPDEDVLAFASGAGRAVLTLNRKHFIHLPNAQPGHAGIVVCTFDPDFVGQPKRINAALASQVQLFGQLIRVNRPAF